MIPISVKGMASMITSGKSREPVWNISRTKIPTWAAENASPRSRKTSSLIFHSPSPAQSIV